MQDYQASPERKPNIQYYDKTPTRAPISKKKGHYRGDSSDVSSENSKEEISGNSYIKQYYLKQYGSAKKGFKPEKQIQKRYASQNKEAMP